MIPKIIHYCWFGKNEKSASMLKCIESWKKFCPDYEIIEWNEDNFDIDCIPFVREAYSAKKWAFVADYARLKIIYENGGIYLDTDVELIKSLDPLLTLCGYAGFQRDGYIATGLGFGAEKGNQLICEVMADYHDRHVPANDKDYSEIACPILNTAVLERYGLIPNGQKQTVMGITFYPYDYFSPKDSQTYVTEITQNTYSIHHYDATWKNRHAGLKQAIIKTFVKLFGEEKFLKLKKKLSGRKNTTN